MREPRPPAPAARRWVWPAAAALAALSSTLLIGWLLGGFGAIRGSTEAWILAHVQRVLLTGDYAAATAVSMIPNTTWNSLYPFLVSCLARTGLAEPATAGQLVSAAALGLGMVALARCWHAAGGWAPAVAGALALLFPPVVDVAAMARYDMLAVALTLGVGALTITALERRTLLPWLGAGLLAGLAYNTREFMLAPALGGLGLGLGLGLLRWLRGGPDRPGIPAALAPWGLALLGLLLGLALLPLSLGLSPLSGFEALTSFGGHNRFGPATPLTTLLYLDRLGWLLGLGLLGLAVAALRPWKSTQRQAVLVLLGMLTPYAAFLRSAQQSPQYYLLAHVLVLSGIAGLLGLLPRRWLQGLILAGLVAGAAPWTHGRVQAALSGDHGSSWRFHSEAWPTRVGEPDEVMAWALDWAGDKPLAVVSSTVENIDSLSWIRRQRPVAFLFREWLDRTHEAVLLADGRDLLLLSVESKHAPPNEPSGGLRVDRLETRELVAELWVLPGVSLPQGGEHPCARGGQIRGGCLQLAWLEAGDQAVLEMMRAAGSQQGLQGWSALRW